MVGVNQESESQESGSCVIYWNNTQRSLDKIMTIVLL